MKNHSQVMSIRETNRLEELEKTIARGKKTFVEVGLALAEIRDLRLYKREYGGFEEYCREKWGVVRFVIRGEFVFLPGRVAVTIIVALALLLASGYVGTAAALRARAATVLRHE